MANDDEGFHSSTLGPGVTVHHFTTKETKSTKQSENEMFDAIFQLCHVEVQQLTDLHPGPFSLGQQLGFVNAPQLLDTLQFGNQLVLDKNVNSVFTIEPYLPVLYWQ